MPFLDYSKQIINLATIKRLKTNTYSNMDTTAYNKNVKLIFTSVLVVAIASILLPLLGLLGGVQSVANDVGAGSGSFYIVLNFIFNLILLAAVCLFAYGLMQLKEVVDGEAKSAVNILFIGAAIAAVSAILGFFHLGIVSGLVGIAVAIVYVVGYNKLKVANGIPENAKAGANLCFVAAILILVGAVIGLIPVLGAILNFLIAIAANILLILGWKKAVIAE